MFLLLDEIYDCILFDDVVYILIVMFVFDLLCFIFNGFLKMYCVVGYCFGWMVIIGL